MDPNSRVLITVIDGDTEDADIVRRRTVDGANISNRIYRKYKAVCNDCGETVYLYVESGDEDRFMHEFTCRRCMSCSVTFTFQHEISSEHSDAPTAEEVGIEGAQISDRESLENMVISLFLTLSPPYRALARSILLADSMEDENVVDALWPSDVVAQNGLTTEQLNSFECKSGPIKDVCGICFNTCTASPIPLDERADIPPMDALPVMVLPCGHEFHKQCIEPWFVDNTTCPICRRDLTNLSTPATSTSTPLSTPPTPAFIQGQR